MNNNQTSLTCLALLLSVSIVAEGAPSAQDLKSNWVELSSGGLIGEVGDKPQLLLTLRNKTDRDEWVKVRFAAPAPNAECLLTKTLKPGEKVAYACAQEKIVPDTDYPIFVTTYRNEELTDEAETTQTTMRFSKPDAAALEEYLAPPALPVTFSDVSSSEKLNVGTALFGGLGRASGSLVVGETGLRYAIKDKITEIAASQIRGVTIRQLGNDDSRSWVTVDYVDGDTARTIFFQGSPFRGAGPRVQEIHKAISYVGSKYAGATQAK